MDRNIWFHKACALVIVISAGRSCDGHFSPFLDPIYLQTSPTKSEALMREISKAG